MLSRCDRCHRVVLTFETGDGSRVCFGCIGRALREADRQMFWERWRRVTTKPQRTEFP